MGYNKAVKTDAGNELLSRVIAGETTIMFTKIATSEKSIDEFEIKQEMTASVQKFTRENKVGVILNTVFSNTSLLTGYYVNTIGIYAKDNNDNEVLFSFLTADDTPTYMEAYNGQVPQNLNIQVEAGLWVDEGSVITIDPTGVATQQWVKDKLEDYTIVNVPITGWVEETDASSNVYYTLEINVIGMTEDFIGTKPSDFVRPSPFNVDTYNNNFTDFSLLANIESMNGKIKLTSIEIPTNPYSIYIYGL